MKSNVNEWHVCVGVCVYCMDCCKTNVYTYFLFNYFSNVYDKYNMLHIMWYCKEIICNVLPINGGCRCASSKVNCDASYHNVRDSNTVYLQPPFSLTLSSAVYMYLCVYFGGSSAMANRKRNFHNYVHTYTY